MLHLKREAAVVIPQLFSAGDEAAGGSSLGASSQPKAKGKQEAKAKGKKRSNANVYRKEGIDADQIARSFLTNDGAMAVPKSKGGLAYKAFCQFSAAARMDAANRGLKNVEIERLPVGKSGFKFKLSITFMSQRKSHEEVTPAYNKAEIIDICTAIMTKQTTKRRKASSSHMVNEEQIAHRSPPLFWSIFYEYMMVHDDDDSVGESKHNGGVAAATVGEAIESLRADVEKAKAPASVDNE